MSLERLDCEVRTGPSVAAGREGRQRGVKRERRANGGTCAPPPTVAAIVAISYNEIHEKRGTNFACSVSCRLKRDVALSGMRWSALRWQTRLSFFKVQVWVGGWGITFLKVFSV